MSVKRTTEKRSSGKEKNSIGKEDKKKGWGREGREE